MRVATISMRCAGITGLTQDVGLGDPGLLTHLLVEDHPAPAKRCRVLVIPHYKDKGNAALADLAGRVSGVEVADIFAPVATLIEQIRAAEVVLSSAMHGLIAADSLGVPNAWLKLSDAVRGGDFKFNDYYSVFGLEAEPLALSESLLRDPSAVVEQYQRPGIADVQARLIRSFPDGV